MAVPKETIWEIDPHTSAKHKILEGYLKAWFPVISRFNPVINYIDGFAGPGVYSKGELGSPIIALNVANQHTSDLKGNINFVFIDEREDRIANLIEELKNISLKSNFTAHPIRGKFHEVLDEALGNLEKEEKVLAPTFVFIDPFGFSGIPSTIIQKLLTIPKVEVFINFSVDSINRFIGTKDVEFHIDELFGAEKVSELFAASKDRVRDLRDLYQIMLNSLARFVRYFEMRDEDDRPIYYLFFASNHELGHLKMKEAMWRVKKEGDFKFSDATDPNQIVLFEKEDFGEEVFNLIKEKFITGKYDVEILKIFVENETAFLDKHVTQALIFAETNDLIEVDPLKTDGSKRRKGTLPNGVIVNLK
jgi:three-Cys-motif partner protein